MARARAALLLGLAPALALALVLLAAPAQSLAPSGAAADRQVAATGRTVPHTVVPRLAGDLVHRRTAGVVSWPGSRIRYWADLPRSFDWSLRAGVAAWNRTGLDLAFVPSTRARAQLRITIGDTAGNDGLATVGHQRDNWVHLRRGLTRPMDPTMSPAYARVVAAHVVAHELGHVLGLHHSSGCRLMTADLHLPDCGMMAPEPGYYDCRVVDPHTLDLALARYGGHRSLAPAACPLDPLPPRLRGVAFEGGLAADRRVELGWADPHAPPGSRVLAMVSDGPVCRFPVTRDWWGEASYDGTRMARLVSLDPSREGWVPPAFGIDTRCYALRLVNRTGAGSPLRDRLLQSWVAAPGDPAVGDVRPLRPEYAGAPGYLAAVEPPADGDQGAVAVIAAPDGSCPTAWPAGEDPADHLVEVAADGTVEVPTALVAPCLAFFGVRPDLLRAGDPVTVQTGDEPPPAPPVVTALAPPLPPDSTWTVTAAHDARVVALAYLVAPSGACVTSWPAGVDPELNLVSGPLDPGAETTPCFTFAAVDGNGTISTGVVVWDTGAAEPGPRLYLP